MPAKVISAVAIRHRLDRTMSLLAFACGGSTALTPYNLIGNPSFDGEVER
jgi:hypothetical protein